MGEAANNPQGMPDQEQAGKIAAFVLEQSRAKEAQVSVVAIQENFTEIARNEPLSIDDNIRLGVELQVSLDGGRQAKGVTQDLSEAGLAALVEEAEGLAEHRIQAAPKGLLLSDPAPLLDPPGLYHESTLSAARPPEQTKVVLDIARQATDSGMMASAGLKHAFGATLIASSNGFGGYSRNSYCEVNISARTQSGKGSGWAWAGTEDAARVDVADAARRAFDLARRTENAAAVEPGRYTVIIEPEALAQLLFKILQAATTVLMSARAAENGGLVFSKAGGGTRIGEQMADPRVQFFYDPADSVMPFSPLNPWTMMKRIEWLRDGVLTNLMYDPGYADQHSLPIIPQSGKARLDVDGPKQTLEEMIAGTRRGIWIHRFSDPDVIDYPSLLLGGVTRDGTFLIENGKVTRPVKNMRYSESPFFILSKLDVAGSPQRASEFIVCPRIKVNDFEFTALSDAI